jgi:MarR family transcriptional regulator for hemolysin
VLPPSGGRNDRSLHRELFAYLTRLRKTDGRCVAEPRVSFVKAGIAIAVVNVLNESPPVSTTADTARGVDNANGPGEIDGRKRAIASKLTVIARQLWQRFDHIVESDGLSRAKWSMIVAVARNPGVTQRTIASLLEIKEATAGQLIDRLCADGYLERREHPKDRRAYCVYLTTAAQPLLGRLESIAKVHENETFAGIAEEDLVRLNALLEHVARNLAISRSRYEIAKSPANNS